MPDQSDLELPAVLHDTSADFAHGFDGTYVWVRRDEGETPAEAAEFYAGYMGLDREEMPSPSQVKAAWLCKGEDGKVAVCGKDDPGAKPYWEIDLDP